MRHAAIVEISTNLLLRLLEFHEGGTIHRVYTKDEWLEPKTFFAVIEHPDLPEVPVNESLPEIMITLQTTCDENGVPVKIERVDPPKRNELEKLKSESKHKIK